MADPQDLSQRTIEETPERVFVFLSGVNRNPGIYAILAQRGFDQEASQEGWRLVLKVSGYSSPRPPELVKDEEANAAQITLDQWDEEGFAIIDATLSRHFPEQAAFVLDGLAPSKGFAAVAGVDVLLKRFDALESSPEREGSRKEDHAALALLARRGIPKEERARLRSLVDKVVHTSGPAPVAPVQTDAQKEEEHQKDLVALRAWYTEWSRIAHAVIRRRDWLIQLGLAKRSKRKKT